MTVSLVGHDVVIAAAVSKLQANMPARIATINADATWGPQIAAPGLVDYYTSGVSTLDELPRAPAIIVAEGNTPTREGDGPHSFIEHTDILVYILEQDTDRGVLGTRLQRQARAVQEALWDSDPIERLPDPNSPTAGASWSFRIFPKSITPGRVFDPDQDLYWRAFYLVIFESQQQQGL